MTPPVILFVSAVSPSQHSVLCEYLRQSGQAETWFLSTPGNAKKSAAKFGNVLGFRPDGKIVGSQGYYYSAKVERSARIGLGLYRAVKEFRKHRKIDVVVAHSLWGAPHFLYDELDAAIVSYIEFPSYRAHGWDPKYPPDASQRLADRNMEMLHYHQVLKSDLTIVPSQHAKAMFPVELRNRIEVQFEGFDFDPAAPGRAAAKAESGFTVGFAARDLSSAKGFEDFVRIADQLAQRNPDMRFVAMGGDVASTYGYEAQWVQRNCADDITSFRDYLLQQYPAAKKAIEFPGKLPYEEFATRLDAIDVFLYPLKYGVANWGLIEILARGGVVLGSDHGFVPELISHNMNGLLLPLDDARWIDTVEALRADKDWRARLSAGARQTGERFHISNVAPRYMTLFRQAMEASRHDGSR